MRGPELTNRIRDALKRHAEEFPSVIRVGGDGALRDGRCLRFRLPPADAWDQTREDGHGPVGPPRLVGVGMKGVQTSALPGKRMPAGMTPTMIAGTPFTRRVDPIVAGFAA